MAEPRIPASPRPPEPYTGRTPSSGPALWATAATASLLGAIVVAAILAGGPSAGPGSAAGSPVAPPSATGSTSGAPTAPAPQGPAWPAGLTAWLPPPGGLQLLPLDPTADPTLAALGPLGLLYAADGRTTLRWLSLAGANERLLQLPSGGRIRSLAVGGPWSAWVTIRPTDAHAVANLCPGPLSAGPIAWSVTLLDLATGAQRRGPTGVTATVLTVGANGSVRCAGPVAPVVALADGRYALAQPYVTVAGDSRPSAAGRTLAAPRGSRIEVRRFDGRLLRSIDTDLAVTTLRLADDGTVAWVGIRPPGPPLPPFGEVGIAPPGNETTVIAVPHAFGTLGLTANGRWAILDGSPLGGQGDPPSVWLEDVTSGLARLQKLAPPLGAPLADGADRPAMASWPGRSDWVAVWRERPMAGSPVTVVAASWGGPWMVTAGPPPVWLGIAPPFAAWIGRDADGRPVLARLDLRRLPEVPLRSG